MDFCIKNTRKLSQQGATESLLQKTGTWSGCVVDWSEEAKAVGIAPDEYLALQRKHKTHNVNLDRASLVKREMVKGKSQAQIIRAARAMGRGYGERMVKADHAALSQRLKKGIKKVQ